MPSASGDLDFFPSEEALQYQAAEQEIIRTGRSLVNNEEISHDPDGAIRWTLTTKVPVYDDAGQVIGLVGTGRDITARKHAEEQLARERSLLHAVMDNGPDLMYVKDPASRFLIANPALVRLIGARTAEDLVGTTDRDWFPPRLAEKYIADEQAIIQSGQPLLNIEEQTTGPDGQVRWLLTSKVPFCGADGAVAGIVGLGRDITARKLTEETLARERSLLHAVLDNLPDPIYVKDPESRYVMVNPAEARLLGSPSPEAVCGRGPFDCFPPELAAKYVADDRSVFQSGRPLLDYEENTVGADGRPRWLSVSKVPYWNSDGTIAGLVGLAHDVTERRRTEEALRASLATNRALLDAVPDTMLRFAGDGRIVNFKAGRDGDGHLFDESVIGFSLENVFPPETAAPLHQGIALALQTHHLQTLEFQLTADGAPLDYEARLVVSAENEVLAILRDITGRKATDRLKNEFISTVSHELRTPLTSIRGSLGLIAGGVAGELPGPGPPIDRYCVQEQRTARPAH